MRKKYILCNEQMHSTFQDTKRTTKLNNYDKKYVGEYVLSYKDRKKYYMKVSKCIS